MSDSSKEVQRATPAKDTVEIVSAKVRHEMLEPTVDAIYEIAMDEEAPRETRLKALMWIADKYLARADKIVGPAEGAKAAVILAETLRDVLTANGGQVTIEAVEAKFREIEEREVGEPIVLAN